MTLSRPRVRPAAPFRDRPADRSGARRLPRAAALAALLTALLALGCAATGPQPLPGELPLPSGRTSDAEAQNQIEAGRGALADGRPWHAAARALALRSIASLSPEARGSAERLLEESIAAAAVSAGRSKDFAQVSSRRLPRRPRAIHAVGRARLQLTEGRPFGAFTTLRELEDVHPTHHLRPEAGDLIARAGFSMARDGKRYLLVFRERSRAPTVLEYLVLRHPAHPRCAEAYAELAALYLRADNVNLALERHKDLLLYHPTSPFALESELAVPRLRLGRLARDDYDRSEVVVARRELETWLRRHRASAAAQALVPEAEELLEDALGRLVRNDLIVARFYRRVDQSFGARLHADRAARLARESGLVELGREADLLLEELGGPLGELPAGTSAAAAVGRTAGA